MKEGEHISPSHVFSCLMQRLGPSAEMVMIDRMFIQEEKLALNQDRVLAKERPGTRGPICFWTIRTHTYVYTRHTTATL